MPTYRYRRADGTTFEHFQKMSDDALTQDPETGEPVERVISGGAGLQFKGSGFYLTDYVKKSGGEDKKASGDAKPAKAEKATAKPAAKPSTSSSD
ncbi:FmdB family zinc ribbon protein [Rubricoccus marinus]|uniref:Putative regulatory protein FmdB zinc ribbon domain-containing protein n=1 Tax=Rubricoccus marinus TaxID=716817 RepID=A0A259TYK2_9BACT|nr:FmdB family zinc ribbon protein [Rubricoccus marinus]OZC02829.1 hypothetical protein BSZ36_07490 [Rubricoccus marinus]